jgi:hypothetical protein
VLASEASCLRFLISLYSVVKDKSNSKSLPKTSCAGVAFSALCTIECIAQAQLASICNMDLDNQNHGLLIRKNKSCSLKFGEHVLQNDCKSSWNFLPRDSFPLSLIHIFGRGYLQNHVSLQFLQMFYSEFQLLQISQFLDHTL